MPNHVINELIFRNVTPEQQDEILALALGAEGKVDFERLVPAPKNVWWGNVGQSHTTAFKDTHMDWATRNWGTKWNAYGHKPIERDDDSLTLIFETAWRPPYGWLAALFNTVERSFEHNWLDEGRERGVEGVFTFDASAKFGPMEWGEKPCSDEMQKHLHFLHWGVESFPDEDGE